MAPIQQSGTATSNSDLTTSSTCDSASRVHKVKKESYSSSSSSHNGTTHNNSRFSDATQQETLLPISTRGHFFHDAFFENARQHFEAAVRNVLTRRGHGCSDVHDDLTSYRMLRQTDLSEDSQAATVTESSTNHQVVMDVRDFMAGDVKVKVVDEDEVVVEGSVEQKSGCSVSKKSFRRSFTFPGLVKAADITSSMSSDGVLTITVPKKERVAQITNIAVQESNTKTNTSIDTARTNTSAQNSKMNSTSDTTAECTLKNSSADTARTVTQAEHLSSSTMHSQSSSSVASSATTVDSSVKRESRESQQTRNTNRDTACTEPSDLLLPISHGGLFFQDSFFTQAHQEFEEAMKKVLHAAGESPKTDVMTSYRSLRERNLTEESQAVSVTEDGQHHKVVMDVRDFMAGDVKVKVVDEDEVVVEGSVEQKSGCSVSKKSFRRSFTFPGLVKAADITSSMSSDGVLTITVPKKERVAQVTNIAVQESNTNTDTSANTTKAHTAQNTKTNCKSNTATQSIKTNTATDTANTLAQTANHTTTTHSQSSSSVASSATTVDSSVKGESLESQQTRNTTRDTACTEHSDLLLPISHGGLFFQDSFFTQAHQEFEEAMKKVLHAAGESPKADVMTSYRNLRERHSTDESQAVSVTEDNKHHKVVIDVRDFMAGDVKVKVVNEDEVVVEGSVEQKNGGSVSKKSFRRSFTFPGLVIAADITSSMSSDGVLTITVPKKESSHEVRIIGTTSKASDAATTAKKESTSSVSSSSTTVRESSSKTSVRDDVSSVRAKNLSNSKTTRDKQQVCESATSQGHRNTTSESSWVRDSLLPVFPKGPFFQDSFFEESRQHFEVAVKEALGRLGRYEESSTDDFSLYRSLRAKDMTDESQAVKVTEDEHGHQVVLDVRDFQGGDLQVKVVGGNEVQVEGRMEKEEAGCKSSRSFRRRFQLPGVLDVNALTSALSSDGVLTIRAPKGRPAAGKPSC